MEYTERTLITPVWTFYHPSYDHACFDCHVKLTQSTALKEKRSGGFCLAAKKRDCNDEVTVLPRWRYGGFSLYFILLDKGKGIQKCSLYFSVLGPLQISQIMMYRLAVPWSRPCSVQLHTGSLGCLSSHLAFGHGAKLLAEYQCKHTVFSFFFSTSNMWIRFWFRCKSTLFENRDSGSEVGAQSTRAHFFC